MAEFSHILKKLRIENGVTQSELAKYLNVSQNAVFNWENKKREPNVDIIKRIAEYFNVSCSFMMGWDEPSMCDLTTFTDEIDDYTQELGEFLYYNPDHKPLFDSVMEVKQKDISLTKNMLDRINGKVTDDDD